MENEQKVFNQQYVALFFATLFVYPARLGRKRARGGETSTFIKRK